MEVMHHGTLKAANHEQLKIMIANFLVTPTSASKVVLLE